MSRKTLAASFPVSRVKPGKSPLAEQPYHKAVESYLGAPVESCSRYHGRLVANVASHPLIAALHGAFMQHYPLVLSPDIIWLTLTHGLAIHVRENAESLRSCFVAHEGQLTISVRRDEFIKGAPENTWPDVFSEFSQKVGAHLGEGHPLLVADFSTTGPVERAASEIALLDAMQHYFAFELRSVCGIPSITLEGTTDDWSRLADRASHFAGYDLEWWIDPLLPILREFVRASAGHVDRSFWDSIYKYRGPDGSGSPCITGWITRLFPYLRSHDGRMWINPWCEELRTGGGPSREDIPNAASEVPFQWHVGPDFTATSYDMRFIGGLLGVSQDPETLALRPEIGWAVRDAEQQDPRGAGHGFDSLSSL